MPPLLPAASVLGLDQVERTLRACGVARETYDWVMQEGRPFPSFADDAMRKAHAAFVDSVRVAFAETTGADGGAVPDGVLEEWDQFKTLDEGEMRLALRSVLQSISIHSP